jgi:hypothetical protein
MKFRKNNSREGDYKKIYGMTQEKEFLSKGNRKINLGIFSQYLKKKKYERIAYFSELISV